jgi:hypothetical protein
MKIEFRQQPDVKVGGEAGWSIVEPVLDFLGDCLPLWVSVPIVVICAMTAWGMKLFGKD